ncbi:hypothetical protein [Saccharopolyspora sp. 5N102]|uniref:hypothetical protein n=1 Tax=Saccharopolyspora sp. 5N102 TaxID=3375155 RepID=UPI0037CC82DD
MLGAGVFAAFAPAAAAAGSGLMIALVLAGIVAYCNAASSAQLAAVYPTSGGTYIYAGNGSGIGGAFLPDGASSSARPPVARQWP